MTDATKCVDLTAEAAYLASVMHSPDVVHEHPIRPDDMTARGHVLLLAAMGDIVRRRSELSVQSLTSELERMGVPPQAAVELALDAANTSPSAPSSSARRLRELGEMRRRREQARRIVEACEAHAVDDARGLCSALGHDFEAVTDVEVLSFGGVIEQTIAAFVNQGTERDRSIKLGTPTIDARWRPYPGSLTVVGAATGTGKSTLLTSWALSMAQRGIANAIVSAEDPSEDFGSKMLGELARVDPSRIWRGDARPDEMNRIITAADEHGKLPISFSHVVSRRLDDVLAAMRLQARRHGARVIAVDYLQTIQPRTFAKDPRAGIDAVLAELIIEAGSLGVALVLASQLRRPERDTVAEPNVTALKESGTIENRAQAIVLLWRGESDKHLVHAKLAKVKRVASGQKFDLVRNPSTGQLVEQAVEWDQ